MQRLIALMKMDDGTFDIVYVPGLVKIVPPEDLAKLMARFAVQLDEDGKDLQACLAAGKLPRWLLHEPGKPEQN